MLYKNVLSLNYFSHLTDLPCIFYLFICDLYVKLFYVFYFLKKVCFKIVYNHYIFWGNNIYLNGSLYESAVYFPLCLNHFHAKLYQVFCFCCSISVFYTIYSQFLKYAQFVLMKSHPTARIHPQHYIQINCAKSFHCHEFWFTCRCYAELFSYTEVKLLDSLLHPLVYT